MCLGVVAEMEAERIRRWAECGFAPDGTLVDSGDEDDDVDGLRSALEAEAAGAMERWLRAANASAAVLQRAWRARRKPYYVI